MKKVIFLFMALIMINAIKAQQTISKDVLEQVKAIVAYEMNVLSLRPNEKNSEKDTKLFEDFKKRASEKLTVNDVKKCLPESHTKSKELCDDIKKMNSEFANVEAVIAYYSDSIFQQKGGAIEKFVKKRNKNELARLKKTIKERIQKVTDETDVLFVSEEKIPEELVEKKKLENTESHNRPRSNLTRDFSFDETDSFMEIFKKYLGYLLAFVVVVVAVILFKSSRSLEDKYNDLRDDKERNDELLQKKIAEVQELQNRIDRLKEKNTELDKQNQALQGDVKNLEETRSKQIRENSEVTISGAAHEEKTPQNNPREYFLGVPQNGKFAEGSEVYRPGKALYKVVSNDGIYGEFEYINRPEAIGYAKQSRTSFLESACNITGEDMADFMQIETKRKGKVERTSDGWKIIKKADVCLV